MRERRRCEASLWLTHIGWKEHIGAHKEWAVRMIQPSIEGQDEIDSQVRQTRGGTVDTRLSQGMDQSDEAGNEGSEEALRRACVTTRILIRRSFKISQVDIQRADHHASVRWVQKVAHGARTYDTKAEK